MTILESQLKILQHWVNDKILFQTFQSTLIIGNIPSKITTKFKADCNILENLLNKIQQDQKQAQEDEGEEGVVPLPYSSTIQTLIEFTKILLHIRQLYNERNWIDLENYLLLKLSPTTSSASSSSTSTSTSSAGPLINKMKQLQYFKESIKEIDNCRWLVQYYNLLNLLRSLCNNFNNFSSFQYQTITYQTSSHQNIQNFFLISEEMMKTIRQGKELELSDEPIFSNILNFIEKIIILNNYCKELKLNEVNTPPSPLPPYHIIP